METLLNVKYNQLYALPNLFVTKSERDEFRIDLDEIEEALAMKAIIACRVADEDFMVVDIDSHGTDIGLKQLDSWKANHHAFDLTYAEKSPSGGYHYYFQPVDQYLKKTKFPSVDLLNQHDVWLKVYPTPGYEVFQNKRFKRLPRDIVNEASFIPDEAGSRGLTMPEPIKVLDSLQHIIVDPELSHVDWMTNGGRNHALFTATCYAFKRAMGSTPERRMGHALWVIRDYLLEIPDMDWQFASLEGFWDFNKGLSEILSKSVEQEDLKDRSVHVTIEVGNHYKNTRNRKGNQTNMTLTGLKRYQEKVSQREAARAEREANRVTYLKIVVEKGQSSNTIKIRPLQELDEDSPNFSKKNGIGNITTLHQSPYNFAIRGDCSIEDAGACYPCEKRKENWKENFEWRQRDELYLNVLVDDGTNPVYVAVLNRAVGPKATITSALIDHASDEDEEDTSITNRWWKLKRTGSGISDTTYTLKAGKPDSDVDVEEYELYDLETIVPVVPYGEQKDFYGGPSEVSFEDEETGSKVDEDDNW